MEATKFASAKRSSPQQVQQARLNVVHDKVFSSAIDLIPELVLILDKNRQAVYCNAELLKTLGLKSDEKILGKRPGEIFGCIRSEIEPGGCGTSEFCRECGAVNAILCAQNNQRESRECRIIIRSGQKEISLDIRVWAIPIKFSGDAFTFFLIRDIQDEKRRTALERIFFHDILNDTAILMGYSQNVKDGFIPQSHEPLDHIIRFTRHLSESIQEQRDLLAAERDEYEITVTSILIAPFLQEILDLYSNNRLAEDKKLTLDCPNPDVSIQTDRTLLWRILVNMIKNALEATPPGGKVTLRYQESHGQKTFSVNNPMVMSDPVKHQVFQRSFSTKEKGRGLGTYSMKLFTENYLKGKVWFESDAGIGTTFFVSFRT